VDDPIESAARQLTIDRTNGNDYYGSFILFVVI